MRQPREGRAPSRQAEERVALRRVEVVRTYLALDDPAQLRPSTARNASARVMRRAPCPVALYRRLYKEVGAPWFWHDRLAWSDQKLADHLGSPDVAVWELIVRDESAGYYELQRHADGAVEIAYFGLLAKFIGQGLGGLLLTSAVRDAWTMGAPRVWLHTCTLDSERALPSYKARGFREFKKERLEVDIEGTQVVGERLLRD